MPGPILSRGQEILLDIKDSARRRVVCGLRWDPMAGGGNTAERASVRGGNSQSHDLDLLCLAFDKYGNFIDGITGQEGHRTGDNGNIYHTGDVIDGEESMDDEQLSLELFNLSAKIHQIFFIAEVQSAHNFASVANAAIRIANPTASADFAWSALGAGDDSDKTAYIFGCLYRGQRGWMFRQIGEYLDGAHVTDWTTVLGPHLQKGQRSEGGAAGPASPGRRQSSPLRYSKEARQRIVCGLNWDASTAQEGKAGLFQGRGKPSATVFDLDLACVMFDKNGDVVDGVSGKPDETSGAGGKVYHSGDDTTGEGETNDDEAISVELRELSGEIHHIVFITEIQSAHTFGDISNPSMRIADGKTNEDSLSTPLGGAAGGSSNAYVFARISRGAGGWMVTFIDEYLNGQDVEDWVDCLKRYLS